MESQVGGKLQIMTVSYKWRTGCPSFLTCKIVIDLSKFAQNINYIRLHSQLSLAVKHQNSNVMHSHVVAFVRLVRSDPNLSTVIRMKPVGEVYPLNFCTLIPFIPHVSSLELFLIKRERNSMGQRICCARKQRCVAAKLASSFKQIMNLCLRILRICLSK